MASAKHCILCNLVACFLFFPTHSRVVRAMWLFTRLFARCTLKSAKWNNGSLVERNNIINAWQKPICTQLFRHIASSGFETDCKKRVRNGYKARFSDI